MEFRKINDEVLYTEERITALTAADMDTLCEMAARNDRKRIRLCTHADADDVLHEMFIVHGRDAYVRPHRHRARDESFQVLSGEADIVIFDDLGTPQQVLRLGDYASGRTFYSRLPKGTMHMVIIRSEHLVFCEATLGPFDPADAEFPDWAPEDGSGTEWEYVAEVTRHIEELAK